MLIFACFPRKRFVRLPYPLALRIHWRAAAGWLAVTVVGLFGVLQLSAQSNKGRLETMKLLTSNAGWASTAHRVFRTADGGAHWRDITPETKVENQVASVFFLDSSTGWVLLSQPAEARTRFLVAATTNGGESWSINPVPTPESDIQLASGGRIDFVDPTNGWMNLDVESSSNFRLGLTMKTNNGGKTWGVPVSRTGPGVAGSLRFINERDGWLAGGPGNEHLYETRDGAMNWHEVIVQAPLQAATALSAVYDLPVFRDNMHGLLPVTFSRPEHSDSALAFYATNDGGNTWRVERIRTGLPDAYVGRPFPSAIVGKSSIIAVASDSRISTTTACPSSNHTFPTRSMAKVCCVSQISFVDRDEGWLLTSTGLLSTSDGGATWVNITPASVAQAYTARSVSAGRPVPSSKTLETRGVTSIGTRPNSILNDVSVRNGFDMCQATTTPNMQTWWANSPYFDTGIYIGGASRSCPQPNLIPAWITAVEQQGWGIMPLWPGPQSPCACKPNTGTYPNCTLFPNVFGSDPTTAQANGKAQADSAATAAEALGIGGVIIYYDLEYYSS